MKYYKIKIQLFYPNNRIASTAVGDKIPNISFYFNKIKNGEIITDAPLFDYFYLGSYDKKKYWEWQLFDVHDLRAAKIHVPIWIVSIDLKNILCNFSMPQPSFFYPSKLLYKGKKVDYYIFQFAGGKITDELEKIIDFRNSIFIDMNERENSLINSLKEYAKEYYRIFKKEIVLKRLQLKKPFDFFPMETFLHDNIVSVRLKQAIEDAGITGFEFSELDYDVVVEE